MATLEQMYNGIYGPRDNSLAPIPAQVPALQSAPPAPSLPTPALQQMYEGIYGPATYEWAQRGYTPPTPPSPPAPAQAPSRNYNDVGTSPSWGGLADMFAGNSRTRTQQVAPAPANGAGYQSGYVKPDNERLLPGLPYSTSIGQSPTERRVQSIPFTSQGPAQANVPLPRARPNTTGVIATYPTTGLGAAFAPPVAQVAAQRAPLRVVIDGANYPFGRGQTAPTPRPASERPVSAPTVVQTGNGGYAILPNTSGLPDAGTWAPSGYTNDGSGKITSNETGGVYYERHLR